MKLHYAIGHWQADAAAAFFGSEVEIKNLLTDVIRNAAALRPSGVKWVDGFNALVRPFLTLCFFGLYAAVKAAQFAILQQDHSGSAATLLSMWGEEDWAVWAAIVTFWFGNRTFNKERGRG